MLRHLLPGSFHNNNNNNLLWGPRRKHMNWIRGWVWFWKSSGRNPDHWRFSFLIHSVISRRMVQLRDLVWNSRQLWTIIRYCEGKGIEIRQPFGLELGVIHRKTRQCLNTFSYFSLEKSCLLGFLYKEKEAIRK